MRLNLDVDVAVHVGLVVLAKECCGQVSNTLPG